MLKPLFYTYLWLRPDGTPYYVGKGSLKRAYRKGAPLEQRQAWSKKVHAARWGKVPNS